MTVTQEETVLIRTVSPLDPAAMPVPPQGGRPTLTVIGDEPPRAVQQATAEWRYRQGLVLRLTDLMLVGVALALAIAARFGSLDQAVVGVPYPIVAILIGSIWLLCLEAYDAYDHRVLGAGAEEYKRVLTGTFIAFALVAIACYAAKVDVARAFVALAMPSGALLLLVGRYAVRRRLISLRIAGARQHRLLVVGDTHGAREMSKRFRREPAAGYAVVGVVCEPDTLTPNAAARSVLEAAREVKADAVAVASSRGMTPARLREIAWALEGTGLDLLVAPSVAEVAGPRVHVLPVAGLPLIRLEEPEFTGVKRIVKEAIDRVASVLAMLVLLPLFVVVAVAIRLDSPGPVFFVQRRVGIGGKEFSVFKFRTMVVDAEKRLADLAARNEAHGLLFKMRRDPRVTRVGRWLRRTSLDELPQMLNVLRGDMSLVGPRPPLPAEVEQYGHDVQRRLLVKPGVTGLWQVSGRSDLPWDDAVRLDLYYVENWSPALDLSILLRTITAVARGSGAY